MRKLPFKTAPKSFERVVVGNAEVGEIELPKMYGLSVNEELFIKKEMKGLPDLQEVAISTAKKISAQMGVPLFEVYTALNTSNTDVLAEHIGEMIGLQNLANDTALHRKLAMVTAVLKYRVDSEWGMEDTANPEQLPAQLMNMIYEFTQKEQAGWVEPEPITEEQLGN